MGLKKSLKENGCQKCKNAVISWSTRELYLPSLDFMSKQREKWSRFGYFWSFVKIVVFPFLYMAMN